MQVTDSGSPAKAATKQFTVTIVPAGALTISTTSLPLASVGFPYQTTLIATGGTLPYTWSITSGLLPAGLNLSASGVVSGTATQSGPFIFTVQVKDASSQTATNPESLTVGPGGTRVACTPGGSDGPASLPTVCIDTTMPDTSAYTVTTVANGASLQSAIDAASCGTVLRLAAGATYTGNFSLPAKSCDASHWIIIRSDVPDNSLPPQGTRMTPAMVTAANLAKITTTNSNAAITASGNSAHYWFFALEIAVDTSVAQNFGLITFGGGSHDLTIDRCYVHGNSTGNDIRRGVTVNGATIAVVDSYIANFHTDTTDAQGIEGWSGAGPFKIVNNHIEGAAQCVMFGGGDPSTANLVPSDIEIRYNHLIIPLAWRGLSGYLVKHPFELKNAQRVLVEGNIMENSWGGQGVSNGTAMVFTPRNQGGNCPWCTVQDVTIRYNIIRHAGEGFNINGEDDIHPSLPGAKFSIHDDLFDDMDYTVWGGGGTGRLIKLSQTSIATVFSHDFTINHVTFASANCQAFIAAYDPPGQNHSLIFTNNIEPHCQFGFWSTGSYGMDLPGLTQYFPGYVFLNNIIEGSWGGGSLPGGTFDPLNWSDLQFVNFNNGNGGDYRLCTGVGTPDPSCMGASPFHNAATDGKDVGADMNAINSATAGVVP
jgi:putative Ig domain-containing protein